MNLLDLLLPRFITEEAAMELVDGEWQPVCSMEDVEPGEVFDGVGTIKGFNLFGRMIRPQLIGDPKPWPAEPLQDVSAVEALSLVRRPEVAERARELMAANPKLSARDAAIRAKQEVTVEQHQQGGDQ